MVLTWRPRLITVCHTPPSWFLTQTPCLLCLMRQRDHAPFNVSDRQRNHAFFTETAIYRSHAFFSGTQPRRHALCPCQLPYRRYYPGVCWSYLRNDLCARQSHKRGVAYVSINGSKGGVASLCQEGKVSVPVAVRNRVWLLSLSIKCSGCGLSLTLK